MTTTMLTDALKTLFHDYEWVHLGLGLIGNVLFFVGSVFFLYEPLKRLGIYAFIVGSFLMLVGSVGQAVVRYESNDP
ncbi:YrhK family protein [Halogeometricum luteum]|uniref:YrhK family protein n=1 Tax=Halogeometricum luteum TaxID=2950537 RepID=A0ABU2G294_9EURY|nr:YrhK family protein [Halogeometricum sp. S3BR5-2]MDS0294369.1 YrhK family protein [Halogeometricum sp. S3BR5-2]